MSLPSKITICLTIYVEFVQIKQLIKIYTT